MRLSENKQLKKPFDRVWARAIGWFDANEVAIERIDERTGYIEGKFAAVTIYMTGTYRLSVFDRYAGREVYRSGPCVSTGELERRIFAFLDS